MTKTSTFERRGSMFIHGLTHYTSMSYNVS